MKDSVLRIRDSDRVILAENDDSRGGIFSSELIWQAPASGEYFVEVAGFNQSRGAYSLRMQQLTSPPMDDFGNRSDLAARWEVGTVVDATIDYPSDKDWLRLPVVAGGTYSFDVMLDSLEDSFLRVIDSDGVTLLAENDDVEFPDRRSRIEWTAAESGEVFIVVSGFDGFVGSYSLTSSIANNSGSNIPGDFDEDNSLEADDIDTFFAANRDGSFEGKFDLNGDGTVNSLDLTTLINDILGTRFGDTDLDGVVAFSDFETLSRNFGSPGGWSRGDFDGNGVVDFSDFLVLSANFGGLAPAL